jgi:2-C-methyl-D-erythritol 4-phosphate cytidylyltransferase
MHKTVVSSIILAGGQGLRSKINFKQFSKVRGKPLIFYSVESFIKCLFIKEIIVVVPPKKITAIEKVISGEFNDDRIKIIGGGKTRSESSFKALKYISQQKDKTDFVIFHDGVRPLVTPGMISTVAREAKLHGAVTLGIRSVETIAEVKNYLITSIPDRENIYETHTPHCYRFDWIWKAHLTKKNSLESSDLVLLSKMGKKIKIISGYYPNIKLTYKSDLTAINSYLENNVKSKKYKQQKIQR